MLFWQIKVFIFSNNNSVGCIYDSTNCFGCINVRRQQFFANITAIVNPLVVKMAASPYMGYIMQIHLNLINSSKILQKFFNVCTNR